MTTERADEIEAELRAAGGQPVEVVPDAQTLLVFIGEPRHDDDRFHVPRRTDRPCDAPSS